MRLYKDRCQRTICTKDCYRIYEERQCGYPPKYVVTYKFRNELYENVVLCTRHYKEIANSSAVDIIEVRPYEKTNNSH